MVGEASAAAECTVIRRLLIPLTTALVALAAPSAWACECTAAPPEVQARDADIVAQVRVDRIETAPADGEVFYTMTPLKVWEGEFDSSFLVRTEADVESCGMPNLQLHGELMLIADRGDDGMAVLTSCSGSRTYDARLDEAVTGALGPGAAPSLDPQYPAGEVKMEGIEPNPMNVVLVGGALLALLGVVLGMLFAQYRRQRR